MDSQCHLLAQPLADPDGEPPGFRCDVEAEHSARPVLTVAGEVDLATAVPLRSALTRLLNRDEPMRELVVDLSRVSFFAAAGIGALVAGKALAKTRGVPMRLRALSAPVRKVLDATGSGDLFSYVSDRRAMWAPPR